ncbi:MAG: OsmC family peroxiredoxin [Bacteroidetes bacterium]|jgi:organic hydroperoxide reductase OsmC/OhrA|nr:OsmC family peroxiredoxin [Bacteroidota bacterium]
MPKHHYQLHLRWTGNTGKGTSSYTAYKRDYEIKADGKPVLYGSADPAFRGDPARYNPEELLIAALSACHKLWYLHLCAEAGITVVEYEDEAEGQMIQNADGGGHFEWVQLRPKVRIQEPEKQQLAKQLHEQAHQLCFIANSCNFPVRCQPRTSV